MYDYQSNLIWMKKTGRNDTGIPEVEEIIEEVFVDERSVGRSEYYAAQRNGIKTVIILAMNLDEMEELIQTHGTPQMATYQGTRYRIERIYKDTKKKEYEMTLAEG